MNISRRAFGCGKFHRLLSEEWDRPLTEQERNFLSRHCEVCGDCQRENGGNLMVAGLLRGVALDEPSSDTARDFSTRVQRKIKVAEGRNSMRYWAPAAIACGLAFVLLFTTLRLIVASPKSENGPGTGSARRWTPRKSTPKLNLPPSLQSRTQPENLER